MRDVSSILDEIFVGQERLSRDEIYRRAQIAGTAVELVDAFDRLPEGEYAQDEVADALGRFGLDEDHTPGVPGNELSDVDLLREMWDLHRTRHETLRHASDHALAHHTARTTELEGEYLRRFPEREIDPERLREGARLR
jgi:hypothetical protein